MRKIKILKSSLIVLIMIFATTLLGCGLAKTEYETITITYNWYSVKSNIVQETLYLNTLTKSFEVVKGKGLVISSPSFGEPDDYTFKKRNYKFNNWSKLGETVYKDTVVTANFSETFDITFRLAGDKFYVDTCVKGEIPQCERELNFSTEFADYKFLNWDKEITPVDDSKMTYNGYYDVIVKEGVTEIPDAIFENNEYLKNIKIPTSVNKISNSAFSGCTNLNFDIDFGSLTSIGDNAFNDCDKLTAVNFKNLASIGKGAFKNCDNIKSVTIPTTLSTIGADVFDNCKNLSDLQLDKITAEMTSISYISDLSVGTETDGLNITIGKNITGIPAGFFKSNLKIKKIEFENDSKCTAIGKDAFNNVQSPVLNLPVGIETIGDNAFFMAVNMSGELNLPNVTSIGFAAFRGCANITKVTLGEKLTALPVSAFDDCSKISEIVLSEGLETIGNSAFYGTNVASIALPDTVKTIGYNAFDKTQITKVTLPSTLETIAGTSFGNSLQAYEISNNTQFKAVDGVLYNSDGTILMVYPKGKTTVILPSEVEQITELAFSRANITSIKLNEGLQTIGERAFSYCTELKRIDFPSSLSFIGAKAFEDCYILNEVNAPSDSNLSFIGEYAFRTCGNSTKLTLPKNAKIRITTVGSGVTIYFIGTQAEWEDKYSSGSGKQNFEYGSIFDKYDDFMAKNTILYLGTDWQYDQDGLTPILKNIN